jgi:hypothetical protein
VRYPGDGGPDPQIETDHESDKEWEDLELEQQEGNGARRNRTDLSTKTKDISARKRFAKLENGQRQKFTAKKLDQQRTRKARPVLVHRQKKRGKRRMRTMKRTTWSLWLRRGLKMNLKGVQNKKWSRRRSQSPSRHTKDVSYERRSHSFLIS